MNYFLIQAIIIAGMDDDSTAFWAQILVIVMVGCFWGVYNLVKKKRNEFKDHDGQAIRREGKLLRKFQPLHKLTRVCKEKIKKCFKPEFEGVHVESFFKNPHASKKNEVKREHFEKRKRDLQLGMEILDLDFLLSMVENIEGDDPNDMIMRKLCFDELFRRVRLEHVNSQVLKVYAVNSSNLYGKDIQCEALQELAERTAHHIHKKKLEPALSVSG
ncbi:MAG: hypothetical protein ACYSUK_07875 [Planctomycetota bacterium]|jgi:hypothetical protein